MKTLPRFITVIAVVAAASVLLPAAAYVLPLDPLLHQLQERRSDSSARSQVAEGTVALHGRHDAHRILTARRSVLASGRCRLDVSREQASEKEEQTFEKEEQASEKEEQASEKEELFVIFDGSRARSSEHEELEPLVLLESLACPLSAGGSNARAVLEELIDRLGVDRRYTGYSRLDGRVAYVIGARPWQWRQPQVWIDKETLLPVRAIGDVEGVHVDVRMLGYGDLVDGDYHPRVVELHTEGDLRATFSVERVERDVELSASLFR